VTRCARESGGTARRSRPKTSSALQPGDGTRSVDSVSTHGATLRRTSALVDI
jgi:hypothetical protein